MGKSSTSGETSFKLDFQRHPWKSIRGFLNPAKEYKRGNRTYLNISASFDIEVTSFFRHRNTGEIVGVERCKGMEQNEIRKEWEKIAIMYAWVFCIDGHAFTGRTWEEFSSLIAIVREFYGLDESTYLIIGVHNLAYEFQFLCKRLDWSSVFAVRERTPIYARTKDGIEFRCTLLLSGYSLAKVGEHLRKYPCRKMVGDLDYTKLRHSKTKLTPQEWRYIVNDGLIVCAYIQELIEENKRITYIPMTKTGFVRRYLRRECYFTKSTHVRDIDKKFARYRSIMKGSTIESPEEYEMLKQAFTGAIVHCNDLYSGRIIENVRSMDETSAYPTQIAIGYFPHGKGRFVHPKSKEEFSRYIRKNACLIDVTFHEIEKSQIFESLISKNKCIESELFEEDNGRLVRAKSIRIVITEIDLSVYRKFYRWKSMTIHRMVVYLKKRLPTNFVKAVLDLYAIKTELKGVEGKESEYMHAKENINSCYGACVTDICRDKTEFMSGMWITTKPDIVKELERYNNSKNRFLCYQWGVWITSLARRALASAIYALGEDYIYSDTDSVKYRNPEAHEGYFRKYNAYMINELKKASEYHHIPLDKFMPKTIKGETKPLGVWDYDGDYKRFKSLGAKRYAVEYPDGHHSLTLAGVNKRSAIPYIEAHEEDFFDFMHFGYLFDEDCCGKNLHTYIDDEKEGFLVDYLGKKARFFELSGVHLMPTTYRMTTTDDYLDLLDFIESTYWII